MNERQDTPGRRTGEADGFDYRAALAACARGERGGLRAIYERDAGPMLGVALRIVRRRELAEEAVQDAFVQIWRRAATFDPARGGARSWLFAIVRNRALNILRDGRREVLEADPADGEEPDGAPDPEEVMTGLSEASRLRRCLQTLEPRRRAGLLLAYAHGLTHGEIAARMGVPLGTAKSWIRRSLGALKECMG